MKCPKCNFEGEANFCPVCGTRLIPGDRIPDIEEKEAEVFPVHADLRRAMPMTDPEEYEENITDEPFDDELYDDERFDEEDEYDDDYDDDEYEDRHPGQGRLSRALGRGFRKVWDLICLILRLVSAVLMLACAFYMAWGFMTNRAEKGLPDLSNIKGDPRGIYLIGAACLIGFAGIQTLWILKKSKARTRYGVIYVDKGHGIFAFLLYSLLYLGAGLIAGLIPEGHGAVMTGMRDLFNAVRNFGEPFLALELFGLILSVLRKICES